MRLALLGFLIALTPFPLLAQNKPAPGLKWDETDLGPFHTGTFKVKDQITAKGIAIKVGGKGEAATVLFDPELLRVSAAWTGGFLKFPRGRGGLEGQISPDLGAPEAGGAIRFSTTYAPGWGQGEIKEDPRNRHQGNLPAEMGKWRGLFVHGERVILSYTVQQQPVLESPGYEVRGQAKVFTRTFQMGKTTAPLTLLLCDVPGASGGVEGQVARLTVQNPQQVEGDNVTVAALSAAPQGAILLVSNGRATLTIPALPGGATFQVAVWNGKTAAAPSNTDLVKSAALPGLAPLCKGGPPLWGEPLETTGKLSTADDPYVADEILLPDDNPFKSWLRPGGHDFFPDGTVALVNVSGDVWIVSGLDEKLEHVKWKRFATGLFEPLGCRVVDGKVYVLGRDQITRLHDLNADGEADHYENFNNDCVVTPNYHEFALDLQTDSKGNFYYAKGSPWTPTNTSPHQGTLLRVSKDGSKLEIFATGLRAPNGLGMGPNDMLTCSDNQGHWMPANRLNVVKQGGFYGMVPAAHRVMKLKMPDGTEIEANPSSEEDRRKFKTEFWGKADSPIPVTGYDGPLVWMPQQVDNSPGGEVFVPPGEKWGPLAGQMLHLSYGHCTLFGVMHETVDGVTQGGVVKFPFKFSSGVMRARFSPKDGQLYASGLNVWQSDASKFGCFYRVRYTGKTVTMPTALHATKAGVDLKFTAPLDPKSATDPQNFSVERWNYLWTGNYGSPDVSIADPTKKGRDLVLIDKVTLSPDRRTLSIALPDMGPAMQMKIRYKIDAADGRVLDHEIHNTIHRIPGQPVAATR